MARENRARAGRPPSITPEARVWIINLACQQPKDLGGEPEFWSEAAGSIRASTPAPPNQNAPSESWHSLLERECLGNESCGDFPDAYRTVTAWIHHYNTVRYHGSLPDWLPVEGYRRALAGILTLKPVRA